MTATGKFLRWAGWDLNGKHSPEREQAALRCSGSRPGAPLLLRNQAAEKNDVPKRKKLRFHLKTAVLSFIPWKSSHSQMGGLV